MPEPVPTAVADEAVTHLTRLQQLLQERGLLARLLTPEGRLPCLRVINPDATAMSEVVSAVPLEDDWWYWWSWPEQIATVSQTAVAADRICRVLATATHQAPDPARNDQAAPAIRPRPRDGGELPGYARPDGLAVPVA